MSAVLDEYVERLWSDFADLVRDGEITDVALIDEVLTRFGRSRDDLREAAGGKLPGDEPDTQPRQAAASGQAMRIVSGLERAPQWVRFVHLVKTGLIREPNLLAKSLHAFGCSVDDLVAAVPIVRQIEAVEAEVAKLNAHGNRTPMRLNAVLPDPPRPAGIERSTPAALDAELIYTPPSLPEDTEKN